MRDHIDQLPNEESLELLDRYFLNDITPAEAKVLRAEAQNIGIDPDTLERLRLVWHKPSEHELSGEEWASRLVRHLQLDTTPVASPRAVSRKYRTAWYGLGSAAALIGVLFTGWYAGSRNTNRVLANHVSTYTTANGQQAKITLPDGSTALLNVGSRLDVPTDYILGNRTLTLTGEALFTVTHHTSAPFTVTAGPSTTRVLGTSFIVRHYSTDTTATIAVQEGKVAVGSTVLTAGNETVVGPAGVLRRSPVTQGTFEFATGALTLPSTALRDAIPQLNRWYDADIRLGNPALGTQRIVGVFKTGSVADLISILELTFDVRVVREGRMLILYPRG